MGIVVRAKAAQDSLDIFAVRLVRDSYLVVQLSASFHKYGDVCGGGLPGEVEEREGGDAGYPRLKCRSIIRSEA